MILDLAACCNDKVATCRTIEVLTESKRPRRLAKRPGGRRVSLSGNKKGQYALNAKDRGASAAKLGLLLQSLQVV